MKERPIMFSATLSVPAIIAERKTQSRRLITPQPTMGEDGWRWPSRMARTMVEPHEMASLGPYGAVGDRLWVKETWRTAKSFDGKPPSAIAKMATDAGYASAWGPVRYADDTVNSVAIRDFGGEWGATRHPMFMPRWASRLLLSLREIRVQRLQEITEDDALAEGVVDGLIPADENGPVRIGYVFGCDDGRCPLHPTARAAYAAGWDEIMARRRRREYVELGDPRRRADRPWVTVIDESARWDANPWVWALTFRRTWAEA